MKLLRNKKQVVKIGVFKIDMSRVVVRRSLNAMDMYNEMLKIDGNKATHKDVITALANVMVELVQIDFTGLNFFEWFKRRLITTKYILNNLTHAEMDAVCEKIIYEPFFGDKKKEQKMHETGMRIIENLTDEQLTTLLSKLPLLQGGQSII